MFVTLKKSETNFEEDGKSTKRTESMRAGDNTDIGEITLVCKDVLKIVPNKTI